MINVIIVLAVWLGLAILICVLWSIVKKCEPKPFDGYDEDDKIYKKAEIERLRKTLEEVDRWDIRWAEGLDSNVERIKAHVRKALGGEK